jgi:TRAP-type transport system small permease protein
MASTGKSRMPEGWIYPMCRVMSKGACVTLFLMMLLTAADVLGRKLFSHSVMGSVELSEFMLLILIFFSLAQTEAKNGHVKVDLVMALFSRRIQAAADMFTQFIGFLLCVLITCSSLVYAGKMRAAGEVSQDLWLPKYPFVYVVAVGCAFLSLVLLVKFFAALGRLGES